MLIKRKRGWELGENQATPEGCYLKRRELVRAMGLGAAAAALPSMAWAETKDPSAGLYPAKRNDKYGVPAPMTEERRGKTHNKNYEVGAHKTNYPQAQKSGGPPPGIKSRGDGDKPPPIPTTPASAHVP